MSEVKQKPVVQQRVSAKATSHARTDIAVRDLNVIIDEPEARGGTNQGATPTETLATALAGCINVISHRVADSLGIELGEMSIDVVSHFDRRGVMMEEALEVPFPQMDVDIRVVTSASDDEIEKLKDGLAKYCPLSNVIRASGTQLNETWHVTRP